MVVKIWDRTHLIVLFAPVGVGRKPTSTLRKEAIRQAEKAYSSMDMCLSFRRTSDIASTAVMSRPREPGERDGVGSCWVRERLQLEPTTSILGYLHDIANLSTLRASHTCVFLFYQTLDTASLARILVQE